MKTEPDLSAYHCELTGAPHRFKVDIDRERNWLIGICACGKRVDIRLLDGN